MPFSSSSNTFKILQTGSPLGLVMGIVVNGWALSATTLLVTSTNSILEASLLFEDEFTTDDEQYKAQAMKLMSGQCLVVTNKLPSLLELRLSGCGLRFIPPTPSVNFSSLTTLDLSGTVLKTLQSHHGSLVFVIWYFLIYLLPFKEVQSLLFSRT
uniref:Uncharacterized protein n=1 Tax=Fagus sylvatica TaxID=28930 RepID=A0A2N9GNI2_FAGSY